MQNRSKLPKQIDTTVAVLASNCPMCGNEVQDKRYKRMCSGFPLTNRRITNRTLTRECRSCGLRFSFTWKTFVNALRKKAETATPKEWKDKLLRFADDIEAVLQSGASFESVRDFIDKPES